MRTNKLLVAAVLATAVGAAMAGFGEDMNMPQPTTSPGVRVPFLHGLPTGPLAGQSELASLERANEWLNSPPLTASALRGRGFHEVMLHFRQAGEILAATRYG
jgi:hypothetical protein